LRAVLTGDEKWLAINLPLEKAEPFLSERIKILPKAGPAGSLRIDFSGFYNLPVMEPLIIAAMEHCVWQRSVGKDADPTASEAGDE
jgi:hypothetical protein